MPFYTEAPYVERVVNIHWKKKPDDGGGGPCGPLPEPLCNSYTNFGTMPFIEGATFEQGVTYPIGDPWGIEGSWQNAPPGTISDPIPPDELVTSNVFLADNFITFITPTTAKTRTAAIGYWQVLMVEGSVCQEFPPTSPGGNPYFSPVGTVPDTYTITFDETPPDAPNIVGMGASHPYPDPGGGPDHLNVPPSPNVWVGPTGSFTYDYKWAEYNSTPGYLNEGNQFDLSVGGPLSLWWMGHTGDPFSSWQWAPTFGNATAVWTITASCIPEPLFGLRRLPRFYIGNELQTGPIGQNALMLRRHPNRHSRFRVS